jgi:uncharacterized protein YjbI with pentapeptide repeats
MADPEALEMLGRGAAAWDEWQPRQTVTDLTHAQLSGSDFSRYEFINVDFSGSDLAETSFNGTSGSEVRFNGCDLAHSSFEDAHFVSAVFTNTDLRHASLSFSSFRFSEFSNVNLAEAGLFDTFFGRSTLNDVQFATAGMAGTVFANCTITRPLGLASANHSGRSSVDISTLLTTDFPESFLRGIGLPDTFITYLDSLKNNPIEYYSCFLSYSSKDDDFARRLYNDLQARGIRTWFAPEDLKIGDRFRVRIDESIRVHDKLVLILSENSIASDWVETEVEAALERERRDKRGVLFPIAIDETGFSSDEPWAADIRRKRHIGDFRKWKSHDDYTAAFERLVRDLKKG